jgi:hypothetical protein
MSTGDEPETPGATPEQVGAMMKALLRTPPKAIKISGAGDTADRVAAIQAQQPGGLVVIKGEAQRKDESR